MFAPDTSGPSLSHSAADVISAKVTSCKPAVALTREFVAVCAARLFVRDEASVITEIKRTADTVLGVP